MFDLVYLRCQLFDCICGSGGWFITRLATGADTSIVDTQRQLRGRAIEFQSIRLKELTSRFQQNFLNVRVEVAFERCVYAGAPRAVRPRLRLVAIRLPESNGYRSYVTNIDRDTLDAHTVGQAYVARRRTGLAFKEL